MDPVARRSMWRIISDIVTKREKCSLILTTHSMEECEALCTRIGIMVGGVLRCLGSSQRLRTRYGRGYQIEIIMKVPASGIVTERADAISGALGILSGSTLNKSQVVAAFDRLGVPSWKLRLSDTGSGAELLAALPNLELKQFACKPLMSFILPLFFIYLSLTQRGGLLKRSSTGCATSSRAPSGPSRCESAS